MPRTLLGCLLAALAMFVWGAAFWMSSLPRRTLGRTADDEAAGKTLRQMLPGSGTYIVPSPANNPEILDKLIRVGPIATIHFHDEGIEPMAPSVFILGYLHMLAVVILLAALLAAVRDSLTGYWSRVGFVTVAGFAAAFFAGLNGPIWWHQPWAWNLMSALYEFGAWTAAGLVLAAFSPSSQPD
jgi:ABC-type Na+ efflux pump permease subunit